MAFKMRGYSAFTITDDKKKETKEERLTKGRHVKGEDKDVHISKSKQSIQELINSVEDRIEFNRNDLEGGRITKKQYNAVNRRLNKRLGYLRQNR
jgi:hypothetical protein